jgi:MFS family permease
MRTNKTSEGEARQLFAQCVTVCTQVESGTQGEFNWSEVEQSVILSSFFWGYLVFQVPGGRVAEVVGAKRVFGGAVLINGVLSLLLPFLARTHWILLLVTRALQGLAQVRYIQSDPDKAFHIIVTTGPNSLSWFGSSMPIYEASILY